MMLYKPAALRTCHAALDALWKASCFPQRGCFSRASRSSHSDFKEILLAWGVRWEFGGEYSRCRAAGSALRAEIPPAPSAQVDGDLAPGCPSARPSKESQLRFQPLSACSSCSEVVYHPTLSLLWAGTQITAGHRSFWGRTSSLWGWRSTGPGCPGRLWSLLLRRYSNPAWTRSCAACSR